MLFLQGFKNSTVYAPQKQKKVYKMSGFQTFPFRKTWTVFTFNERPSVSLRRNESIVEHTKSSTFIVFYLEVNLNFCWHAAVKIQSRSYRRCMASDDCARISNYFTEYQKKSFRPAEFRPGLPQGFIHQLFCDRLHSFPYSAETFQEL